MSSELAIDVTERAPIATTWPLAGSREFERADAGWRARTLGWLERTWDRHVIDPWFPRAIDRARGGFHSEFDHRWRALPEQRRLLEHQARQTRSLARLAIARPEMTWMSEAALDGLRYLRSAFWDAEFGGLYTLIAIDGTPLLGASKHVHGQAYAIGAAAEVYRLTGAAEALQFAFDIFTWLEEHVLDTTYGGYHGWATRGGQPILSSANAPADLPHRERDHLGHGVGLKDANVHTDLLEALAVVVEVSGDEAVRSRLDQLYDVVTTQFTTPGGAVHYLTDQRLMPVPGLEQFGYPGQVGYRLCRAAAAVGRPLPEALSKARVIADHLLGFAMDPERHGVFEAGPSVEPTTVANQSLVVRAHLWWTQTEAAQLLLTVALEWPDEQRYGVAFEQLLGFLERDMLDGRHGGMLRQPRREETLRQRLLRPSQKADQWKDASHETDMWLHSIRMLRGLRADAPIGKVETAARPY